MVSSGRDLGRVQGRVTPDRKEKRCHTRREFLKDVASGTAGLVLVPQAGTPVRRREVSVGGRRVKVVDVHGHCLVPEVQEVIKDAALAGTFKNLLGGGNLALGTESFAVHG